MCIFSHSPLRNSFLVLIAFLANSFSFWENNNKQYIVWMVRSTRTTCEKGKQIYLSAIVHQKKQNCMKKEWRLFYQCRFPHTIHLRYYPPFLTWQFRGNHIPLRHVMQHFLMCRLFWSKYDTIGWWMHLWAPFIRKISDSLKYQLNVRAFKWYRL